VQAWHALLFSLSSLAGFSCTNQPDGDYADPSAQCSQTYYSCAGGFTWKMQCAEQMYFDQISGGCMEREWVQACGGEATTLAPFVRSTTEVARK
jgi:hypothetical protein